MPSATAAVPAATGAAPATPSGALPGGERIRIETDLAKIELDTVGGDLRRVELLKHKQTYAYDRNFVLLDETAQHTYVAQSGLIGPGLPTHLTKYRLLPGPLKLEDGQDQLVVKLEALETEGFKVGEVFAIELLGDFHKDRHALFGGDISERHGHFATHGGIGI